MFRDWDDFYLLVGSAAGALIGLLFVVVTLTAGMDRSRAQRGQALFMTPTVVHFATVVTVAALAMAPRLAAPVAAAIVTGIGLAGTAYSAAVFRGIRAGKVEHWSDTWDYGVLPIVFYLALTACGVAAFAAPGGAAYAVAVVSLAFLFLGVRNAWDLVTWIAPRRDGDPSGGR
jgi:hypothetical protein